MSAPSVTVPGSAAKIATPFFHDWLAVPGALVKLVVKLSQVPVPPCTVPSATVVAPFQNCVGAPAALTTKLTCPVTAVVTVTLAAEKPDGKVPNSRVRLV